MEGDIFLESFSGQSVDELIEMQKSHRIDSLVLAFESALDARKESGEEMLDSEIVILAVEAFEREVNNGGFSQFFYNSSVEYVSVIVNSLTVIECKETAALTQQAIDCLGLEKLDPDLIEDRMDPDDEKLESALGDLDDRFYDSDEAIAYKLFEYIKINRNRIRFA